MSSTFDSKVSFQDSPEATPISLARRMAQFAVEIDYEQIPEEVIRQAKLCMLDSVGVAFASGTQDFARRAVLALDFDSGSYPVLGLNARLTRRDAALLNGILIHGLDYDDTHVPGVVHVSSSALPTALAAGIERRVSGSRVALRLHTRNGGEFSAWYGCSRCFP